MYRILFLFILVISVSQLSCKSSPGDKAVGQSSVGDTSVVETTAKEVPAVSEVLATAAFESKLAELKNAGREVQLIDVRTPGELAETGFIDGAVNLDWNGGQFNSEHGALNKQEPVMLYCRSGGRSGNARKMLLENGFMEVYDLAGGITGWVEEGRPVVKTAE